eukprot:2037591-Pyramimonas_sp.AAC.1
MVVKTVTAMALMMMVMILMASTARAITTVITPRTKGGGNAVEKRSPLGGRYRMLSQVVARTCRSGASR